MINGTPLPIFIETLTDGTKDGKNKPLKAIGVFQKIPIKPLSVNEAWQGKRYKTDKYKEYQAILMGKLKNKRLPEPPYEIYFQFGFSNSASDVDNPVKPLQDILQKKFKFDDKNIHKLIVEKRKVPKGEEFIYFEIKQYKEENE